MCWPLRPRNLSCTPEKVNSVMSAEPAAPVRLAVVVPRRQRLAAAADDLQEPVGNRASFGGHRGVDEREDAVELHLLDVLGRVDTEARDPEAGERDQVARDLLLDARLARVQVREAEQLAVLHRGRVGVVVEGAGRVEVLGGVEARVAVLRVRRAGATHAGAREVGHVVDDRVHVDADAGGPAPLHHVGELRLRARAAARQAVAHGLVALAPVLARREAVLLGRGHLHGVVAHRAQEPLALLRDVGPLPLEEVDEDVAGGHVAARAIGGEQRRPPFRR